MRRDDKIQKWYRNIYIYILDFACETALYVNNRALALAIK